MSEDSRAVRSAGITTAARTSPDLTLLIASARDATGTESTWSNSCSAYALTLTRSLPTLTVSPGGVSLTIATRGRAGLREIANPISSAIAIG